MESHKYPVSGEVEYLSLIFVFDSSCNKEEWNIKYNFQSPGSNALVAKSLT